MQDRPAITLYPSSQEDAGAYMAAIRLASAVRNSMDAQKAGADGEDSAIDDDSSGRRYPDVPAPAPAPANSTTPEAVPTLNQTSSAHFTSNITEPGFVRPQDNYPSPSNSTDTGTWPLCENNASAAIAANLSTLAETPTGGALEAEEEHHGHVPPLIPSVDIDTEDTAPNTPTGATIEAEEQNHGDLPPLIPRVGTNTEDSAADTHTSVTIEALEEHHGRFPPPEPPIGATPAPPAKPVSGRAVPMPIEMNSDTLRAKVDVPNGVPPQCQLYATNTDIHTPFAVCPVTKRNSDLTHDLASQRLHSRDAPHSHILAIRNTVVCEAPADFHQHLVCGQYNGCFALSFFILFSIICLAWILKVGKQRTHRLDEENGAAIRPSVTHVPSTNDSDAKYREDVLKAHQGWRHVGGNLGTEQYQPVAWRSSSHRAARANVEGNVKHDAGPVAGLPGISSNEYDLLSSRFNPRYGIS